MTCYFKKVSVHATRVKVAEREEHYRVRVSDPAGVAELARRILGDEDREVFLGIPLDAGNRPMGFYYAATGAIDVCPVDVREVFRPALVLGASSLIVVHNHPSGSTEPSKQDISLTVRLIEAGRLIAIPVLDHVIVADGYCALAEHRPGLWRK